MPPRTLAPLTKRIDADTAQLARLLARAPAPRAPSRAPQSNPTPKAWKGKPPSTPYPCGKAEGRKVGVHVPGPRGGTVVGCATPNKTKPHEGQFQTRRDEAEAKTNTLRKSVVARRVRNAKKEMVSGLPLATIVPAAEAALRAPEPHIPYPTGVEYPHVTGSAKCAPDHKLWLDAEAAREDIRERLALELPEDEELTDDLIAAQLATDPRYPAWVSAEQACATAVVRRASERGTEATDSDRRTLMRKRAAFINQGGDVTSAAYFDDVLEPEQREGFFKRQWEKSGRTSPVWRRLYEQTRDKRVAAKLATRTRSVKIAPPKRTKAPAVRAAAKTIKANPAPSAQACVGHRVVAATSIRPPHEVRRPAHLRALAARMRAHGWVGRPLLVEHSPAHGYQAWTGSHRIAAAQLVGLDVPIVVVPSRAFARTGMKPGRSGFYFHAIRPTTAARHAHAQACGCPYATALLAAELESDRARGAA